MLPELHWFKVDLFDSTPVCTLMNLRLISSHVSELCVVVRTDYMDKNFLTQGDRYMDFNV